MTLKEKLAPKVKELSKIVASFHNLPQSAVEEDYQDLFSTLAIITGSINKTISEAMRRPLFVVYSKTIGVDRPFIKEHISISALDLENRRFRYNSKEYVVIENEFWDIQNEPQKAIILAVSEL